MIRSREDLRCLPYGLGWFVRDDDGERLLWHTGLWDGAYSALYVREPGRRLTTHPLAETESTFTHPKMTRVTGIGGIFFKGKDAGALREWYSRHLGIKLEDWGGAAFSWQTPDNPTGVGTTVWSVFEESSPYFEPSTARFMINYRVADLHAVLDALRAEGCDVADTVDESELGKFGWVMDPEGNRIELWQPPAGR